MNVLIYLNVNEIKFIFINLTYSFCLWYMKLTCNLFSKFKIFEHFYIIDVK